MVPVSLTSPDFMLFATGGLVLLAVGAHLVSGLPSVCPIAAIWLAALATTAYLFSLGMDTIVSLIGCIPVAGLAVWLTTGFRRRWRGRSGAEPRPTAVNGSAHRLLPSWVSPPLPPPTSSTLTLSR